MDPLERITRLLLCLIICLVAVLAMPFIAGPTVPAYLGMILFGFLGLTYIIRIVAEFFQ